MLSSPTVLPFSKPQQPDPRRPQYGCAMLCSLCPSPHACSPSHTYYAKISKIVQPHVRHALRPANTTACSLMLCKQGQPTSLLESIGSLHHTASIRPGSKPACALPSAASQRGHHFSRWLGHRGTWRGPRVSEGTPARQIVTCSSHQAKQQMAWVKQCQTLGVPHAHAVVTGCSAGLVQCKTRKQPVCRMLHSYH